MIHTMVILHPVLQKQLRALLAHLPPRRHTAARRLPPAEVRQHAVRVVEDVALLLERHVDRVFVRVPVQPDLVAGVTDGRALLGERPGNGGVSFTLSGTKERDWSRGERHGRDKRTRGSGRG